MFHDESAAAVPEANATDCRGLGSFRMARWRCNERITADSNVESPPHSVVRHGGPRPLLGSRAAIAVKGGRRHFCDMSAGFCAPSEIAAPLKNRFPPFFRPGSAFYCQVFLQKYLTQGLDWPKVFP